MIGVFSAQGGNVGLLMAFSFFLFWFRCGKETQVSSCMTFHLQLTSVVYVSQSFNIAYKLDAAFVPSEHRKHHVLKTHFCGAYRL